MRWRTVYREALSWRELEGELVVRNACTGSTHLLNSLACEVFRALLEAEAGIGVAELSARLDEATSSIEAVLADFERLGLASASH